MTKYKSPPVGNNISFIFNGLNPGIFYEPKTLEEILKRGLKEDNLHVLDWFTTNFNDGASYCGYTMLVPLSESHLSVHTYREHNSIAFGIYSCLSPSSGMKTYRRALKELKPKNHILFRNIMPVTLREIEKCKKR